ncbi:MAG: response regulator [Bacteroidota bacterium]|nr:response regulator [Bacteroidota bacterium]MDP3144327.1 response regulator [Bacteroidota bacterium]MDP3556313.1 response regulator [Bacteroidota bacterium]
MKKKVSILIVEDNDLDKLVLKVLLEKYFNLYFVSNGQDALLAVNEFDFNIVLLDINLGDSSMNGLHVISKIRENSKNDNLKIFAVTAYTDNKEELMELGFKDVLIKPVIKDEILEILNANTMLVNNR